MTGAGLPPELPPERASEIHAHGDRGDASTADLVAAAAQVRRALLASVPIDQRPGLAAIRGAARVVPPAARPRVRVLVGVAAALVAAGTLAAGMAGLLPSGVQDTVHDGGEIIGIHLPAGDEMREVDILDVPGDAPLWDDGHHGDAPADGHSHEF